jgi:hypothetical protein
MQLAKGEGPFIEGILNWRPVSPHPCEFARISNEHIFSPDVPMDEPFGMHEFNGRENLCKNRF